MLPPQLPPNDLLAFGKHFHYGRHDPVERRRAYGHHDPDGFFGDDALRPDPVWMAIQTVGTLRPVTTLAARIRNAINGPSQRRDVACIPER